MTDIPREFEGWKLLDPGALFGLWETIGNVTHGDSEWVLGRSINGMVLFLSTDLPHPDDETQTCSFHKAVLPEFETICKRLTGAERATTEEVYA